MKIQIEYLMTRTHDVVEVGRIPCVGELVCPPELESCHEVREVMHVLDADPATKVTAIIRVK